MGIEKIVQEYVSNNSWTISIFRITVLEEKPGIYFPFSGQILLSYSHVPLSQFLLQDISPDRLLPYFSQIFYGKNAETILEILLSLF